MNALRPAVLALIGAVALAVTGCASSSSQPADSEELTKVVVGVTPNTDIAPIFLGNAEGFFEEEGLELDLQMAQGGAALLPAVVSGEYDYGFANVVSLMVAKSKGLDVRIVSPGAYSTGVVGADTAAIVTMPGSGIKSAGDLVGRTIATNGLGTIFDATAGNLITEAGGDPAEAKWVELPWPDQPAALAAGRVDAAQLVEPFLTIALEQGAVPVVWNWVETDPDLLIASYFSTDKFLGDNKETNDAFVRAMSRSLEFAQENPEKTRASLADYTELDPAIAEKLTMSRFETDIKVDSVQVLADLALEYDLIAEPFDVSSFLP
jgi:NitT/TauT family transport system substrate-binding protein